MVYVILGMHKSGTTLISNLLHQAGINMIEYGANLQEYDHKGGKMERQSFLKINNLLLKSEHVLSLDIPLNVNFQVDQDITSLIRDEIAECGKLYMHWGFKDPRTCVTYPIWKKFLPEHKIIAVFRHPMQVMSHYLKYFKYSKKIEVAFKALKMYYAYNYKVLEYISNHDTPSILINYHDLMTDKGVIQALEKFVDCSLVDVRKPQQYRKQSKYEVPIQFFETFFNEKPLNIYKKMDSLKSHF